MTAEKIIETNWFPEQKLLETRLVGDVSQEDVAYWKKTLEETLANIEVGSSFKILVDFYGFKAIDLPTHKLYREVIPLLLADYNWKVGYVDLFEEAQQMKFSSKKGITCFAAAHVHQDEEKIKKYQENFGRENERFFTDPQQAKDWIRSR